MSGREEMRIKKIVIGACAFFMIASSIFIRESAFAKTTKLKLNKKNITLEQQKNTILQLNGAKKGNGKWKSTNKKIATVQNNGKVCAKRVGSCKIIATYFNKKYICKVIVVERAKEATECVQPASVVSVTSVPNTNSLVGGGNMATSEPTNATDSASTVASQSAVEGEMSKNISLSVCKYDKENQILGLKFHNETEENIEVGYGHFWLYKLQNGQWEMLPQLEMIPATIDLSFLLPPKEEWSESIVLKDYYGTLSSGRYKIEKKVCSNVLGVEFLVD